MTRRSTPASEPRHVRNLGAAGGRGRLGWRRLLLGTGFGLAAAMAVVAAVLGDLEAAAVAVALGVSTWLVRGRRGTLGAVLVGLVAAVTLFFMLAAAVTSARTGAPTGTVLLPAVLAALALAAMLSAVGTLSTRGRASGPSTGPWAVIGVCAVLPVALWLWSLAAATNGAGSYDVTLETSNLAFSQTEVTLPTGEATVGLANSDLFWHTFTVPELGVDLLVPVAAERSVTFDAPAGTYEFICRIPGHPEAGMVGTLTVEG